MLEAARSEGAAALPPGAPQRLTQAGGVRLTGFDLSQPLSADQHEAIQAVFLAHHIVVFPEQTLSREQQFAFAASLGEVEPPDAHRHGTKRHGVAHVLTNLDQNGHPTIRVSPAANYHWHTDKPYRPAPPKMTMLYAVEMPPDGDTQGGNTEFANTALAYEAVPEEMKHRLDGLRVVFRPAFDRDGTASAHPLVRTHPETGRKALYLGNHATHVLGLPETESAALLGQLLEHATQRQFVYPHRWRIGDLVMWDNRCLLHRVVLGDALRLHRRILHRNVVRGTIPF